MKLENLTIVIADDHPLFRNALRQALGQSLSAVTWHEADSASALNTVLTLNSQSCDLILLDLQMPGSHGYSTLIHLRSHYPSIPVVVISAHEDVATISRAMHYGSCGFIPKSASLEALGQALNCVLLGDIWLPAGFVPHIVDVDNQDNVANKLADLTPQQYRVLQMFAEGLLNKQIAYDFGVSEATIKAHATAIFRKLGVRNRTQAVIALKTLEMDKVELS